MGIVFEVSSLEEMCAVMCDNWYPGVAVDGNDADDNDAIDDDMDEKS